VGIIDSVCRLRLTAALLAVILTALLFTPRIVAADSEVESGSLARPLPASGCTAPKPPILINDPAKALAVHAPLLAVLLGRLYAFAAGAPGEDVLRSRIRLTIEPLHAPGNTRAPPFSLSFS
jgi:hypothetical protein